MKHEENTASTPKKPRALFGRKVTDLDALEEMTNSIRGSLYEVTKEIWMDNEEFKSFAQDFFEYQPWIEKSDGGSNEKGEIRCIRVINTETGQRVLVNSEGYGYCRYVAIEED
ncbi:hypothetical protein J0B03_05665 [Alkalibacter rhizosphaerae]|uniref:Uncharacterized protein n=1 Tax=Alkalibacter rhizosphaerae TaxID=2815577 RepID=A0A975AJF3_9FIRM|nr:hypothetical protein [Alkalibacter rhizosphaerae]QSX09550.1 hypothetical protein J0B03_05665 [Alkalibacter rhizosphaerae]